MISALPYVAAAIGMIAIGASSDRTGERFLHIAIPCADRRARLHRERVLHVAVAGHDRAHDRGRRRSRHARPVLGAADALPDGQRRGRRHRTHQHDGVARRLRRPLDAVGFVRDCTGSFAGGLVFLAVLLLLAAGCDAGAARRPRARRLTAEGIMRSWSEAEL